MSKYKEQEQERLHIAGIEMDKPSFEAYSKKKEDLGVVAKDAQVPEGYKRCGKCGHALKFYLFSKNKASKTCTAGNCRACQNKSSAKSYAKTKKSRNYKAYYEANKERKKEHAKAYYESNKEAIAERTKEYRQTKKGKKVMQKCHAKRRASKVANAGIPYTRDTIISRETTFLGREFPVCYLCGKEIKDISGAAMHLDHVISITNGGKDCFTNLLPVHSDCNLRKSKDDKEVTAETVATLQLNSEAFIDAFPELFEEAE